LKHGNQQERRKPTANIGLAKNWLKEYTSTFILLFGFSFGRRNKNLADKRSINNLL